jgi:Caspase domain
MPRNLALLVGVDRYPNLPEKNQLRSCANDARLMARVLRERFGFGEEGLRLLVDEDATREKILTALGDLLAQVRKGDSVVFYFSGHGSEVPDAEGDEPSGMDQTIVPHDSGRGKHPNRDVIDDEIYEWVLKVSAITTNLTIIADTCYSGTVTREPREKWIEADTRRPEGLGLVRIDADPGPRRRDAKPSGLLPVSDRYVLLAACREKERAKELPDKPYSAFTWFLCQELLGAPAEATYRDVIEKTRDAVGAAVKAQTPQLEGARDRLLFGGDRSRPAGPADGVETRARYSDLLKLADEDESNPLRGCLEVRFLRHSANGTFRPARPEKATGEIVYNVGEYLALRVVHHADKPLYIHVLDLGLAGGIGLLHPVDGANEALVPGRALESACEPVNGSS